MKNALKKLVSARWFPTASKSILTGLASSGIVYGLHAAGITAFVPHEVNAAVEPLVGFLVAAIVQKPGSPAPVATVQVTATTAIHMDHKPGETLGKTIAQTFLEPIAAEIDKDPALVNRVAAEALTRVMSPAQAAEVAPVAADVLEKLITRETMTKQAAVPAPVVHDAEHPLLTPLPDNPA